MHCSLKTFYVNYENSIIVFHFTGLIFAAAVVTVSYLSSEFTDSAFVDPSCAEVHLITTSGFNTFLYQHKSLPLVLRGEYYPYCVVGFENKHKSKRKRNVKCLKIFSWSDRSFKT